MYKRQGQLLFDTQGAVEANGADDGTGGAPALSPALATLAAGMRFNARWLACTGREQLLIECPSRPERAPPTGLIPPCTHPEHDVLLRCAGERDRVNAARETLWTSSCAAHGAKG